MSMTNDPKTYYVYIKNSLGYQIKVPVTAQGPYDAIQAAKAMYGSSLMSESVMLN